MQPRLFTLALHLGCAALGSLQSPTSFPELGRSQLVQKGVAKPPWQYKLWVRETCSFSALCTQDYKAEFMNPCL